MIDKLKLFYAEVDKKSAKLETIHAERLDCKQGCSACCVDDITVFDIEVENITQNYAEFLENAIPNDIGMCAFLGENNVCRIYEDRPYLCRTQGLPFRWFDEIEDELVKLRDIYPLNEDGEPIETLEEDKCWTISKFESKLTELQKAFGKREMKRKNYVTYLKSLKLRCLTNSIFH